MRGLFVEMTYIFMNIQWPKDHWMFTRSCRMQDASSDFLSRSRSYSFTSCCYMKCDAIVNKFILIHAWGTRFTGLYIVEITRMRCCHVLESNILYVNLVYTALWMWIQDWCWLLSNPLGGNGVATYVGEIVIPVFIRTAYSSFTNFIKEIGHVLVS